MVTRLRDMVIGEGRPIILMAGRYRILLYESVSKPGNREETSAILQTSSDVEIVACRFHYD